MDLVGRAGPPEHGVVVSMVQVAPHRGQRGRDVVAAEDGGRHPHVVQLKNILLLVGKLKKYLLIIKLKNIFTLGSSSQSSWPRSGPARKGLVEGSEARSWSRRDSAASRRASSTRLSRDID